MTWLTEDDLDIAYARLFDSRDVVVQARWALRAREWMVRVQVPHSPACAAATRARNAECVCGLRELMEKVE
jgi:hypothetical protein